VSKLEGASRPTRVLKFGVFEVDLESAELRKSGMRQRLAGQPFRVLQLLLERSQEIVTREELRERIWPQDTFVDYDLALKKAVNRLREVLGDSAESPRFIETIPRRGYRFIAPLAANGDTGSVAESAAAKKPWWSRRSLQIGIVLGLGAAALLLALLALLPDRFAWRRSAATATPAIRSLAVLPLENLSGDPGQEYFSDGMTDALITELAQIGSLKVISRTSSMRYRQTRKSLPEIARELNVDGIVEGTVQRSGQRVRITAQFVQAASDKHLWAGSFERDTRDVFALERDIAEEISGRVQAKLTTPAHTPLAQPRPVNPKVLEAYLQGNYSLTRFTRGAGDEAKRKAAEYFQQAIDADPQFAPAYVGLFRTHSDLLWPSKQDADIAGRAAERAVELDPNLADARDILGDVKLSRDWDFGGAEQEYRRAIALNPTTPMFTPNSA